MEGKERNGVMKIRERRNRAKQKRTNKQTNKTKIEETAKRKAKQKRSETKEYKLCLLDVEMGKRKEQIRIKIQGNLFLDNCVCVRPHNKNDSRY
jgi:hypothetical protein